MTYHHLTYRERIRIENLLMAGCSQAEIARRLHMHRSTIKKELDRNTINGVYKADTAQSLSCKRKKRRGVYLQGFYSVDARKKKSFWLVRHAINRFENNKCSTKKFDIRFQPLFRPCENRLRPKRKFNRCRPTFEAQQCRAWLLGKRVRNHFFEGMSRAYRSWLDFRLYHRAAWRDMKIHKKRTNISKYFRKGPRTLLFSPLRLSYRKSIHFRYNISCPVSDYQPYPFTRFDWLFRKSALSDHRTASPGSRYSSSQEAASKTRHSNKRTYKVRSLKKQELKPVTPFLSKAREEECPGLSKMPFSFAGKIKKAFKKTPKSEKQPRAASFFA